MPGRFLALLASCLLAGGAALAAEPASGFIHGTVTWPGGGSSTGFIRWESEEAFWDDLFHTGYRENPWSGFVDKEKSRKQRRKNYYESHGLIDRIMYALNEEDEDPIGWRMLLIRIGDIERIEIHDGEDDFLVTADGSRHRIGGYGNDDGADLLLYTGDPDPVEIEWNDLTGIEFMAAPAGARPYAERLYGTVETPGASFEGFIQWDVSECLSTDVLDGRLDGRNRDYLMGEIRSIARAKKQNAVDLVFKDGSTQTLGGSNDVNDGNRGIMVENPAWGRVIVPWERFVRVTFSEGHGTGPGRETYDNGRPLTGTVALRDGGQINGRLVIDADEGWRWDIFNGSVDGFDYNIPFFLIQTITPLADDRARLELRSGLVLELGENQDTGKENAGVLVFPPNDGRPRHLLWSEVAAIRLDD
jgi:hypothetical protein